MTEQSGVYAVCVGASVSDDPVRWLFTDEADADDFAAAINADRDQAEAWVSFEPIASSLENEDLRQAFPEEVQAALARRSPAAELSD